MKRRLIYRAIVMSLTPLILAGQLLVAGADEALAVDSADAFVTRLYQQVLNRNPDPIGLNFWVDQIQRDGAVAITVLGFFGSAEFVGRQTSNSEFVTILYHTFLDREPDPPGLAFLLGELQTGHRTRANLVDSFTFAPEFAILASFLPPESRLTGFVTFLYLRILGRNPDPVGMAYHVSQLLQTGFVELTLQTFLESPEFQGRQTTNEEFMTILYRACLQRDPDPEGLVFWVDRLVTGVMTRRQVANLFAVSNEFQSLQVNLFSPLIIADVRGLYRVSGTVTQSNCPNPQSNRTFLFAEDLISIRSQSGAAFSGFGVFQEIINGVKLAVAPAFIAGVSETGQVNGTFQISSFANDLFEASSTGTLSGSVAGDVLTLSGSGQVIQSACSFTFSLSGSR